MCAVDPYKKCRPSVPDNVISGGGRPFPIS